MIYFKIGQIFETLAIDRSWEILLGSPFNYWRNKGWPG